MGAQERAEFLVGSKISICFQLLFPSTQLYGLNSLLRDRPSWQMALPCFWVYKKKTPKTKQERTWVPKTKSAGTSGISFKNYVPKRPNF